MHLYMVAALDSRQTWATPWNKPGGRRGETATVFMPISTPASNASQNGVDPLTGGPWWFETEKEATWFGEWVASRRPGIDVCVAKVITSFEAEPPKIITKSVSEKGVLPK